MIKKLLPVLIVLFSFLSCQYELLPEPSTKGNDNAAQFNNKKILPPANVTASHGDYRSVTLNWDSVKNATQYQIYSADTEFDTFEKVGETKGSATSFTIQETTGVTKAYYVKSVDYFGNTSRPSYITIGSSLSVPIITDITKNQDGDIYTLNWWMTNCSESTYEDLITYTINCYEEGSNSPTKIELPGNITSYDLTGLKQSTVYKFTIEAYKTGTKQKHEISDIEPIETGHKIVPDAVKDFTASQGTNTSEIKLSFTLPSTVESTNGDGTYEKENPIYFTLKRKAADENDYTTVYNYIGFNSSSKYATGTKHILTGTYTEGQAVEIIDEIDNSNRGKKYSYILQSYTDVKDTIINQNLSSTITSVTHTEGWTLAQASFKIETDNTIEPITQEDSSVKDTITNISVTFHMNFDNQEIPYSYFLTSQKYSLTNPPVQDGSEEIIKKASNIKELDDFSIFYNSPKEQEGYYEYKLYITEKTYNADIPSIIYELINSPIQITVTDDTSALPVIKYDDAETFRVEDGYKDKFILSWNNIENCTYLLSWQNKIGDGYSSMKTIGPFSTDSYSDANDTNTTIENITIKDGKVVLTHSATSGEIRSYTLTAIKGLSNSCEKKEDFYTLGTAVPEMQTPDYETITVIWDKVQKAKDNIEEAYTVSAKYAGSDEELINNDNYEITQTEDNKIKCIISKPEGYDDATKSGKAINLSVTTIGEHDETSGTDQVYTLGPANMNVLKDPDLFFDHINISWNRVEGAKGYLVYRVIKNNLNQFIKDSSGNYETGDVLYVTKDGVYSEGSKISSASSITTAETIVFTDSYEYTKHADAVLDSLKKHQIQLTWGLPISYTVIPVLNEKDINFEVTGTGISAKQNDKFTYKNLSNIVTSTFGYGLNVKASKATSNTEVTITWDQPYEPGNLLPKIYRRKNANSDWEIVTPSPTATDALTMTHTITYGKNETNTYEYAVVYNNSEFDKTYIENLESNMDSLSPTELSNKGYTLSLPQGYISAESAGGFKEKFSWEGSTYDFTKRNIGPDYYEIQMLNKNKATGWTTIAKIPIDKANNYRCTVAQDNAEYQSETQVKYVSSNSYQAIFEPIFNSDNITTGQMQVLRDYKHYYRLVAVKMTDSDRAHAITAVADIHNATDGTKATPYAIRDIKDEELMRCISLIIADAINQSGINDGGDPAHTDGAIGKFTINHPGATKTIKWGTQGEDYQHKFRSGLPYEYTLNINNDKYSPTELISPFIISLNEVEKRSCADGKKLYCLPEGSITIKNILNNDTYGLKSKLTFKMGERGHNGLTVLSDGVTTSWTVTITYNSKTLTVNPNSTTKEADYKNIFPFDIGGNHEKSKPTYDPSLPEYQSPWWEEASQGGN